VDTLSCHQTPESKEWYRGSADALRHALPHIRSSWQGVRDADEIVVVGAHDVYYLPFRELVAYHRAHQADVTVVTQKHGLAGAHVMGVCRLCSKGARIAQFVERPSLPQMQPLQSKELGTLDVSLGMYVFKLSALERLLEGARGDEMDHIGADVIPTAVSMGLNVVAYTHEGSFHVRHSFATCIASSFYLYHTKIGHSKQHENCPQGELLEIACMPLAL
jgi:glucose-1-phosphate adenylyltransferase